MVQVIPNAGLIYGLSSGWDLSAASPLPMLRRLLSP